MSADADDFNSSDIEIPSPDDDGDDNIGARGIARIKAGAVQDRINSKIAVKTLTDSARCPSMDRQRKYWWKLFSTFVETTLKIGRRPK